MTPEMPSSWRNILVHIGTVFLVAAVGCASAFALWLHDLSGPQAAFLGSGNRLSLLVSEGPARLVLAIGDDPIAYENAFSSLQPLFARRVDLLLVAGSGESLLVPMTAHRSPHVRSTFAVAPLTPSPESAELEPLSTMTLPARIRLGPTVTVTIETASLPGADPSETFPAWRATVARGDSRIVLLSDGAAAPLFPPAPRASLLAVSGSNPLEALQSDTSVTFVANAESIDGPEFRDGLASHARLPAWGARVAAGEVLRVLFREGAIEFPSDAAQPVADLDQIESRDLRMRSVVLFRHSARPSRR